MTIKEDEQEERKFTRRGFVKIAATGAGAATLLSALHPQEVLAKVPKKWDLEADIVVVGAGGAGLAAATEAGNRAAKVVVLEKMPVLGGSSAICGGALAFAGTDIQAEKGIKDSNELLYKDMMTVGENVNVPALVRAYVDNQMETYQWLKGLQVNFLSLTILSGMTVPRSHNVKPGEVIKILSDAAKGKGAKIFLETAGRRLVVDDNTGKIRGIVAEKKGKTINYGARKGVIMTSGGFARNKILLGKFAPPVANAKVMAGLGSTGDGMKMAWACGADLQDMPYIKATFGFDLEARTITEDIAAVFYHGAIIVNKEGKRFYNESKSYKLIADVALVQTDGVGFQVYDSSVRERRMKADPEGSLNSLEKRGRIFSAPSLAELAQRAGISPAALEETVKEYNANVDKGRDPQFGRSTLAGGYGKPVKIETPPFYAFPSTAAILGTYGGILINEQAQVLDVFGNVIPGLYAAGEITGGVHGAAYMTGTSFGKSLIFGRLAAKNVMAGK
jgi:fumarate reductase flavoprotein subunit